MTPEIGFLLLLLIVMVVLFLTEKLAVDLTAFLGLAVLIFAGYVGADEAFTGFASSAVITMLSIFIVSAGLLHTGVADLIGGRIYKLVGGKEVPLIITLMLVAGVLSAFMNNIAATAVLMPAVSSIARRAKLSPSRLFMPLAFGAILGGTTTMVGTPPNILAAAMLEQRSMTPFALFDFTPIGLAMLLVGTLFMATIGRRLLPKREMDRAAGEDLGEVYQIQDQLFSLRIPQDSPLDGVSLAESQLGSALSVQVVAISRAGKSQLAPEGSTRIRGGDVLLAEGRLSDLKELLRVQQIEVDRAEVGSLPRPAQGVTAIRMGLAPNSPFIGSTLRSLKFREQFEATVVAIYRSGRMVRENLAEMELDAQDQLVAICGRKQLKRLASRPELLEPQEMGLSATQELQENLYLLRLPKGSPFVGETIARSRMGELMGLTVGGIIREGSTYLGVLPTEILEEDDRLIVSGEPERILRLRDIGEFEVDSKIDFTELESEEIGMVEATLSPRSALAGRTLAESSFRDRYGVQVLALWREGKAIYQKLAALPLRVGDALLLQGPRDRIRRLAADADFVVLSQSAQAPRRTSKAPFALGGLLLMVGLVISGIQPIAVASFTAASLVVLAGALTMEEAYRAIEWKAIFLVAAILPVGIAMERTGAAELLAQSVTGTAGTLGPYAVLAALIVLSSLLSQGLDGAPAVVLLTPVAIDASQRLGLSPYPIMMGISLAASAAFMTPFSHKANLLVMGAGGYRAYDYLKVGSLLTIVILAMMVFMIPWFFPF